MYDATSGSGISRLVWEKDQPVTELSELWQGQPLGIYQVAEAAIKVCFWPNVHTVGHDEGAVRVRCAACGSFWQSDV